MKLHLVYFSPPKIHPKPNTLMMVMPNACIHCAKFMDPDSHRYMLKWIFVGDHRRQKQFGQYSVNNCGDRNPNFRGMMDKKARYEEAAAAAVGPGDEL